MNESKVALIWPDFNFYHIARFRALFEKLREDVLGIELIGGKGEDETSQWRHLNRDNLPIVTLFPKSDIEDIPRKKLGLAIVKKLEEWGADVVFVNGYSAKEFQIVIDWAKRNQKKCFTFSETKRNDFKRFFIKEWIKKRIVKKLSGAICGGRLQKQYLVELGMPEDEIFFGYDVVDNIFFKEKSKFARMNDAEIRKRYNVPEKHFLSCSRFVKKKNLLRLLDAYKIYRGEIKDIIPWALVLCGAGSQENELKAKVKNEHIEEVYFPGSKNPEELAIYYGLASCFVLASTIEQWGLVVNEAMASGLPVLVTKVAGAAHELVDDGVNGYKFDPLNAKELSELFLKISNLEKDKLKQMGENSQKKITSYSPELFAENIIKLIHV